MTVARVGPTSAMSAKNSRNANDVQTTASASSASSGLADTRSGTCSAATGAHPTAVRTRDVTTTPTAGRSLSRRLSTMGPAA